jgi:hypothetical protein
MIGQIPRMLVLAKTDVTVGRKICGICSWNILKAGGAGIDIQVLQPDLRTAIEAAGPFYD